MGICGSDREKEIHIDSGVFCEMYNNPNTPVNPEAGDSTSNITAYLTVQDNTDDKTNIKQSGDQPQNAIDQVKIKHEVDSDLDIDVDLTYRILDTFNVCEVKTFKREGEKNSPDTKTSLKLGLQTDHTQTQLVEVDNNIATKADLHDKISNNLSTYDTEKLAFIKEIDCEVDSETINLEDEVNEKTVRLLQSKGTC